MRAWVRVQPGGARLHRDSVNRTRAGEGIDRLSSSSVAEHMKLATTWVLTAVALLSAGSLSGCGRSAADDRTEVRFCFFGGYEEWKLWQRMAKAFEAENPDIRMKLLYWPGPNYEDKVKLVMAAGT